MSELVRLSLSLENELFKRLESLVKRSGYTNRSEFIRDLVRERLVEEQWRADAEAIGTLTVVYDHHARGLGPRLTRAQHGCRCDVLASTHIHLDAKLCAEMIMVRGRAGLIHELANRLKREKGVLFADLSTATTGKVIP